MLTVNLLSSCRDKVICPAYQSTYILDDSVRQTYFSYLWKIKEAERQEFLAKEAAKDTLEDQTSTTPSAEYFAYVEPYVAPEREIKRTKYGIVRYQPYLLKNYRMRTVPMENIIGMPPEEPEFIEEGEFLASDFQSDSLSALDSLDRVAWNADSISVDSLVVDVPLAVRSEDKGPNYLYKYDPENRVYNMDQVYYNKYFGESLIAKPKKIDADKILNEVDSASTEKEGFFKRLFRKKKQEPDSTYNIDELIQSTDDQLDQNATEADPAPANDGFGPDNNEEATEEEEESEGGGGI